MLTKETKIFIAGRYGMAGKAIEKSFIERGYNNIVGQSHKELDLRDQRLVQEYFKKEKPGAVILAAAKVGGILANIQSPAEFLYDNLSIQNNIINSSYNNGVKRLLFLASSCIYPRLSPQPMKEEYLLTGKLEPTNEGYAIAKIAGIKLCEMYNKQYGTNFLSVIPCNLYGPNDNFDPNDSHVIPGLIKKIHDAKYSNQSEITIWGTGTARREFMYNEDLGDACSYLFENYKKEEYMNIGTGQDISIKELVEIISEIVGYKGNIKYDNNKPDGMPQKLLSIEKISSEGWSAKTSLREGLHKTYKWYLENVDYYNK